MHCRDSQKKVKKTGRSQHFVEISLEKTLERIPSRELTYPTWGKGKSSTQKCLSMGYVSSQEGIVK